MWAVSMFIILKSTIPVQRRLQRDHLNNRSANMTWKHKPSIIMPYYILYAESNQEIVLNGQFIFIFPLIAF